MCPPWPWQPRQSYLAALGQPVCPPQHSPARPTLQHRPRIDDSCPSYSSFSLLARLSTSPKDAVGTSQLRRERFRQDKQACHSVSRATWGEGGREVGTCLWSPAYWPSIRLALEAAAHAAPRAAAATFQDSRLFPPYFMTILWSSSGFENAKAQKGSFWNILHQQSIKGFCFSSGFQQRAGHNLMYYPLQNIVINTQTGLPRILTRKALLYQLWYRPLTFAY